ncbi:HAD family hydrolase [Vibrio breoganii]
MLSTYDYDIFIFDCDGVILDSNQLKIEAMKIALKDISECNSEINSCIEYFRNNFGSSRFHHVEYFINDIFLLSGVEKDIAYEKILRNYSSQCKELYLEAELTPGIQSVLEKINGSIYIASGSEQEELREVFNRRGLTKYFNQIYGSPTSKVDLVRGILQKDDSKKAVMFGDAFSDMRAAEDNGIDFVAYLPYSNVKTELLRKSQIEGFVAINSWEEIK